MIATIVFNGLKHSDLIIFNVLSPYDEWTPMSITQMANMTGYCEKTIRLALQRLLEMELIERYRDKQGFIYQYRITGDTNGNGTVPHS